MLKFIGSHRVGHNLATEQGQITLKSFQENTHTHTHTHKKSQNNHENRACVIIIPDFRLLLSYTDQYIMVLAQNRHIDQCNIIEGTEINPVTYDIYNKGGKDIQCIK